MKFQIQNSNVIIHTVNRVCLKGNSDLSGRFISFTRNLNIEIMAKKSGGIGSKILFFLLGMLAMLALDMIFHFNNSVKDKLDDELNKAQKKIEDVIK